MTTGRFVSSSEIRRLSVHNILLFFPGEAIVSCPGQAPTKPWGPVSVGCVVSLQHVSKPSKITLSTNSPMRNGTYQYIWAFSQKGMAGCCIRAFPSPRGWRRVKRLEGGGVDVRNIWRRLRCKWSTICTSVVRWRVWCAPIDHRRHGYRLNSSRGCRSNSKAIDHNNMLFFSFTVHIYVL